MNRLKEIAAGQGRATFALTLVLLALGAFAVREFHMKRVELAAVETRISGLRSRNEAARSVVIGEAARIERDSIAVSDGWLPTLEQLVPAADELPELLAVIAAEAQASAVELTFLQPIGVAPATQYSRLTVAVGLLGRYHDIARFLARIATLPRIVTPAEVTLNVREDPDGAGSPVLNARLLIYAYTTSPPSSDDPFLP
jgi:Tfp pilus assembly protein PilO